MKKNLALLCLLFLLSLRVSPQVSSTKQRALALTHMTVIDTTGAPAQPDVTIVIRGDRIVGMGKSGKIRVPAGSQVVNAAGKFLIPGLWDMNVFWYNPEDYLRLFIANGVTGVREVLGYAEHHEFRREIEAGRLLGPRMVIGTRWILGPIPSDPDNKAEIVVANGVEARQAVIEAQKYGADFIEVGGTDTLSRNAFLALVDEAKKRGIPLEGHVPISVSVEEASNAGLSDIDTTPAMFDIALLAASSAREADVLRSWQQALAGVLASNEPNLDVLLEGPGYRARMELALDTYDPKKAKALFDLLKANHTWMCPTLIAQRNHTFFDDPSIASDPRLKYLSPGERSWFNDEKDRMFDMRGPDNGAVWRNYYHRYFEIVGAMHRAGVGFLAGTTTEEPLFTVPGFSLHDELALLVQAGFTPMEALQTATVNSARFLGKEHDFGTVAPGKFADLVLLDANPLVDISNTRKITAVVYRGKLYPRASLDAMLARVWALASRKSIGDVLGPTIKQRGVEAAIQQYRELKSTQADAYDFEDKYELSSLGHPLLRAKKFKEAIQVLELNAEAFPRSWWAYDELGEAHMGAGEKELAIKNYKKSLELDPANQNATVKLKQLNSQ